MSATQHPDDQQLTESIGTTVTPETKRQVRIAAAYDEKTQAEFVRDLILDALDED